MAFNKIKNVFTTNKISAIFFDMDNTLIPTRKGDTKACNKVIFTLYLFYNIKKYDYAFKPSI